jgi:hypothetical protein
LRIGIGHVAQPLAFQAGGDKAHAFEIKRFARIGIKPVAALLGFLSGDGGGNQFRFPNQAAVSQVFRDSPPLKRLGLETRRYTAKMVRPKAETGHQFQPLARFTLNY